MSARKLPQNSRTSGPVVIGQVSHLHDVFTTDRVDWSSNRRRRARRRSVARKRAGRMARHAQQPPPATHRLLFLARWVARSSEGAGSPVAFLVATLRWPPDSCAAGLDFLWGAAPRDGHHLVSMWSFARRHKLGHVSEKRMMRLSHDLTKMKNISSGWGSHKKCVPWFQHTRGSPRHVSKGICFPFHRGVRPGWGGGLAETTPAPYAPSSRRCSNGADVLTIGARQTPGRFWCRHSLFRRAAHCCPSAGLLLGGQFACRQVTPGKPGMWSAIVRWTRDWGLFAPQSSCPEPSRRQGHTCRAPPWACSVSSQSDATRKEVWPVLAELAVSS